MKSIKPLAAIICAATLTSMATANAATTVVRFTGSSAYRSVTHTAILAAFDSAPSYAFTEKSPGDGLSKASLAIFSGNINGNPTIIKTSWSGSEAGIQTVASPDSSVLAGFLANGTAVSLAGTVTPKVTVNEKPDVAMSDTYQSTSAFNGTYKGVTYPKLTEAVGSPVGVIGFRFVASSGSTLSNITSQQARALFSSGQLPLSMFTANPNDATKPVTAIGRDPDSGTRLSTFAEIGLGATASVSQYQPQIGGVAVSTSGGTIDGLVLWPSSVVNGITVATGNGGYSSGGDLAKALGNTTTAGVGTLISYLGDSDAATAVAAGGKQLNFNGITPTVGAIKSGKYSFWSYEHMYYRSGASTSVKTIADSIATSLSNKIAPIKVRDMKVSRVTDGSTITPR